MGERQAQWLQSWGGHIVDQMETGIALTPSSSPVRSTWCQVANRCGACSRLCGLPVRLHGAYKHTRSLQKQIPVCSDFIIGNSGDHTGVVPNLVLWAAPHAMTINPHLPRLIFFVLLTYYIFFLKKSSLSFLAFLSYFLFLCSPFLSFLLSFPFLSLFLSFTALGLSCCMWDLYLLIQTLSCRMWDLVTWPGIEPKPPAFESAES